MGAGSKTDEPDPDVEKQQTLLPAAADEMFDTGCCKACTCATLMLVVLAAGALFAAQLVAREEYLFLALFASQMLSFCVLTSLLGLCTLPEDDDRWRLSWAQAAAAHVLLWSFAMALLVSMALWVVESASVALGASLLGLALAVVFACCAALVQSLWPGKFFWWRPAANFLQCVPGTICHHEYDLRSPAPALVPSTRPFPTSVRSAANETIWARYVTPQRVPCGLLERAERQELSHSHLAERRAEGQSLPSALVASTAEADPSPSTLPGSPIPSNMCLGKAEDCAELARVFKLFNWNDDTRITRKELEDSLGMMGIVVPADELAALIEGIGAESDGCVDVEEFRALYRVVMSKSRGHMDLEEEEHPNAMAHGLEGGVPGVLDRL